MFKKVSGFTITGIEKPSIMGFWAKTSLVALTAKFS